MVSIGLSCALIVGTALSSVQAAPVSNSGTGTVNGGSLDLTNATVNLNQVPANAISGTVYTDEGVTTIADGTTVRLLVNGVNAGTDTTVAGAYSITPASLNAGDAILVYIDNNDGAVNDGTTVTVSNGSSLSGLDIYVDHVITRHDNTGNLTNALMDTAKGAFADTEILYSVTAGNLTVTGNTELYIPAGHTFDPGSNVSTMDIKILGTLTGGVNNFTISGNWDALTGSFNFDTSTVIMTGSGKTISSGIPSRSFYNLTVQPGASISDISGLIIQSDGTFTVSGSFTVPAGINLSIISDFADLVVNPGGVLTVTGRLFMYTSDTRVTHITNNGTLTGTGTFFWRLNGGAESTAAPITATDYGTLRVTFATYFIAGEGGTAVLGPAGATFSTTGALDIYDSWDGGAAIVLRNDINNNTVNVGSLDVGNSVWGDGRLVAGSATYNITGNLVIDSFSVPGEIDAGSATFNVGGNWTNNDIFSAGTSTVNLNGSSQTISGSTTFYNLTKSVAAADTLTFQTGSTQTITGTATLNGAAGQLLSLRSDSSPGLWNFTMAGGSTKAISFVDVMDSDASGSDVALKPINPPNSVDSLNTIDWFGGSAVTSVLAEISPNAVSTSGIGIPFSYDLLPTINPGDSGLDQFILTAPAGYSSFTVTAVSVGGAGLTANCPVPGAGQYCSGIAGQVITVSFGTKITTSLTNIRMDFSADTPGTPGSGDFTSTVDDTSTGAVPPQAAIPGNSDGDGADSNSITVTTTASLDPLRSTVTVNPDIVVADGVATSTITVTLIDSLGNPVSGKSILLSSNRGAADTLVQPLGPTDANGQATGTIASGTAGEAVITADDITDGVILAEQPSVYFTQGKVIELTKLASKKEVVVGDIVTYRVELKNTTNNPVTQVKLEDRIPPNFKYINGSTLINGAKAGDPAGFRTLIYDVGTIPPWVDLNGNGLTDSDEPGYLTVSYQLVVGSGANPGDYTNVAVAKDVCDRCTISNTAEAKVTVTLDPFFDLATIIGKVYEDKNKNGFQDRDDPGISGTMVVLDDGTYALTDEHGRYHFPAVRPGQRMVKINVQSIAIEARTTTAESVILTVTPGILSKANFGITYIFDRETIGRGKEYGILMEEKETEKPIEVVGSVETLTVLINGQMVQLPSGIVRMRVDDIDEVIEIKSGELAKPVVFQLGTDSPEKVKSWSINIVNYLDEKVRVLPGEGPPPASVEWDGITDDGTLVESGHIYHYGLDVEYLDGTRIASPRRIFGIDRTTAVSLNLTGGAFKSGSNTLSEEAREVLKETAGILRKFPNEIIVIEGHTDSTGPEKTNLELSKNRAQAAVDFLVKEEKINKERFVIRWFGETRPIAGNGTEEGRLLNRRVEINGEIIEVDRTKLYEQYRTQPTVRIDGFTIAVDPKGRFSVDVESQGKKEFEFEGMSSQGRVLRTIVPIPAFELFSKTEDRRVSYGGDGDGISAAPKPAAGTWKPGETVLNYTLKGRTEPGNLVQMDGESLEINSDGTFDKDLNLSVGNNSFGFVISNPEGYTRITNLLIKVSDRDEEGNPIIAVEPVPNLSVNLPPEGFHLNNPELTISGLTDPGNSVKINGEPVTIEPGGEFRSMLNLPKGKSKVVIGVTDPEGYSGTLERNLEVSDTRLFFLAFAEGEVGKLKGKGFLEGAGMKEANEYYNKGRVSYYLKGVVSGKYLVTSAFDSGTQSFGKLFKDLDDGENDRLLTNIDPDQLYPVYGDSSTLVYDTESQGKFYLAIDGDAFKFLVGNYPIIMNDTELATYQRTLYGSRLMYKSASQTKYGSPDTQIVLFGAEVKQAHIRDEFASTGGSLYYLSHKDIVEGSEQVTLLIRDKNTGIVLSRIPQDPNKDYTIKYEEGRIFFNGLVSTTVEDSSLVDSELLNGNPVSIQVDYESEVDSFEKTAAGGRVRKQLGDNFALGGTYVKDELEAGSYELMGIDSEVRLGKNTRIVGEYAETSGTDSLTFLSSDGGLSFDEVTPNGVQEGKAWKAAVELDPGEWFGISDRIRTAGYFKRLESGFLTSGNFMEQGTQKYGVNLDLKLSSRDNLLARYDREEYFGSLAPDLQNLNKQQQAAFQWRHKADRWTLKTEYQYEEFLGRTTGKVENQGLAAVQLRLNVTEKLITKLEHQQTISGESNNQSTVGVEYQVFKPLSLEASATQGTLGRSATGGAVWNFGKNRIYLSERLSDNSAGRTASTVLGNETQVGKSGKVYSEYQWERADTGNKNLNLMGAKNEWEAAKSLKFQLAGEFTRIKGKGPDSDRYTLSPGFLFGNSEGLKALTRAEIRRETGATDITQYISLNNFELKLNPDFTLLGKYRYSVTSDHDNNEKDAELQERSIGLAYRPIGHDRFNALARLTRLSDEKPFSLDLFSPGKSTMDVFSVEWSLQLTRFLEWVDKEAARIKRDSEEVRGSIKSRSYLSIHRLNLKFARKFYLGLEYRLLRQLKADDQKEGWLTELSVEVAKHLRFGIGYNFTDFSDNEFSNNDYSVQGWFIRAQGRF